MSKMSYQRSDDMFLYSMCKSIIEDKNYSYIPQVESYLKGSIQSGYVIDVLHPCNEILIYYIYYILFSPEDRIRSIDFRNFISLYNAHIVNSFYNDPSIEKELKVRTESGEEDTYEQTLFKVCKNIIFKHYIGQEIPFPEATTEKAVKILNDFFVSSEDRIFNTEIIAILLYCGLTDCSELSLYQQDKLFVCINRIIDHTLERGLHDENLQDFAQGDFNSGLLTKGDEALNFAD
jgi:hypothetical protein